MEKPSPSKPKDQLVSIVLSFRNEEDVIDELIARLNAALVKAGCVYELIFVNDASTDRSLEILARYAAQDERIKVINLSRRFGVEPGFFAGLAHARGDAVITIDADLQDPPEVIPEMISKWRDGTDVVYTIRTERQGEPFLKMFFTRLAYHLIHRMATIRIPINAGDFRLLSRRVVDILLKFEEPNTYLRGLVAWVGFRSQPVFYVRHARAGGETHFKLLSKGPVGTLFYGVTGFSAYPVYFVVLVALATGLLSTLALLTGGLAAIFGAQFPSPFYYVSLAIFLWSGLLLSIGVVGLYVSRTFRNTLQRPRYLVDSTINCDLSEIDADMPR